MVILENRRDNTFNCKQWSITNKNPLFKGYTLKSPKECPIKRIC